MKSGLRSSRSSFKSQCARTFLRSLRSQLSPAKRIALDSHLDRLTHLDGQIQTLDAQVEVRVERRPERELLATLPGVASLVALTIMAVITKQGSRMLRWAVVEAVQQLRRHSPSFHCLHRRLARRKGRGLATVACGRQLLEVIWCMLRRHEPFHETQPVSVERKERRRQQRLVKAQATIACQAQQPERLLDHLSTLRELADRGAPHKGLPPQLRGVRHTNGFASAPSG